MDEHRLTGFQIAAVNHRKVGGVVVEHECGALAVIERVGKREGEVDWGHGNLGEAAEHAESGDALARLEA